ncbi:MAG: exodeoxyribonuclease VII large subunit, partial [Phenylobacterium sp.]|nr:exodeoxyribonuclease VII large subunit [Phenylobacterium sp.]
SRLSPLLLQRPQAVQLERVAEVTARLAAALSRNVAVHARELAQSGGRLQPGLLQRPLAAQLDRTQAVAVRLAPAIQRKVERLSERLETIAKVHDSLNPDGPLKRGFARVMRADGSLVRAGASLEAGEDVSIKFGDAVTRRAVIDGGGEPPSAASQTRPAKPRAKALSPKQGDLF